MNDRFKFRVWWEQENRYRIDVKIHPIEKFFRKGFIIEQCTGLKDKKGNLIYEGDIVRYEYGEWEVVWRYGCYVFKCLYDNVSILCFDFPNQVCEIIGNIHEQKEQ